MLPTPEYAVFMQLICFSLSSLTDLHDNCPLSTPMLAIQHEFLYKELHISGSKLLFVVHVLAMPTTLVIWLNLSAATFPGTL